MRTIEIEYPETLPAILNLSPEAFESNYIAPLGPTIDAFEQEFSEYVGIKHCVALSSGTAALHLALRILGVGQAPVECASLSFGIQRGKD